MSQIPLPPDGRYRPMHLRSHKQVQLASPQSDVATEAIEKEMWLGKLRKHGLRTTWQHLGLR